MGDDRTPAFLIGGLILAVAIVAYKFIPRSTFAADGLSPVWDATVEQSHQTHMPSLVLFTADYCCVCRSLHENVLSRPEVINEINRHYLMCTVDLTNQGSNAVARAQRYGVSGIPVLIRFGADGKETGRTSYLPPGSMVVWLRAGE